MQYREKIKGLLDKNKEFLERKYKVKSIGLFGSYARGKLRKGSDIDILVEFSESPDFFEFIRLEKLLESMLGRRVDLVTKRALKPLIKEEILKEAVYL